MTLAFWCVLVTALMPYAFTGMAKFGKPDPDAPKTPRYDNHAPRAYLEQQTGRKLRAHWAQLNAFEAFPAFAAAVIIATAVAPGALAFTGFSLAGFSGLG